ncbi:MAG: hypothetical protein OEQ28_08650, partial [Acidobacteriota bacterium]|nr:hypothetical protein [Acidobacteriota bacterium]
KWVVTYLQTIPGIGSGVWEGEKEGKNMVMRQKRGENESRLTFSNITENSFDWIGENVGKNGTASGWKISCKRREK